MDERYSSDFYFANLYTHIYIHRVHYFTSIITIILITHLIFLHLLCHEDAVALQMCTMDDAIWS